MALNDSFLVTQRVTSKHNPCISSDRGTCRVRLPCNLSIGCGVCSVNTLRSQNPRIIMNHRFSACALALTIIAQQALCAGNSDWPQWHGPNRDGVSQETGLNLNWSE